MKSLLFAVLFAVAGVSSAFAIDPVNKTLITGVAIKGYDPVAYFMQSKALEGDKKFEYEWNGATWRFASAANRDAFMKSPAKFAPQYGGYCAYGVSEGYAVGVDPTAWKIVEGRLYLNYNAEVQQRWLQDVPGRIKTANEKWPRVLAE